MTTETNQIDEATEGQMEFTGLDHDGKLVFLGLMLGMFVAAISQTIVGPAMPRIVAELGGMEHYSWIATAAMLVSAVAVPVVGKLSDMYGRKTFYIAGLVVFMLGSTLSGMATNFWFLVVARAVQGLGMGTLMPLSQTIIGDIIPPRQRGKYQGVMGAVFGVSSIAGPLFGGWVTDNIGWRWLFYLTLPLGIAALAFLLKYMHLPHVHNDGKFDLLGALTLTPGLTIGLLAVSWGGNTYDWDSSVIITMFAVAAVFLVGFVVIERRATNPLIPLQMMRDSRISLSILASFAVAVAMFGGIIYIPVFAQGVLGVSATNSGAILIPLNLAMIVASVLMGFIITKWGKYKALLICGGVIMSVGYFSLARLTWQSSQLHLTLVMVVIGIGLGMCMQTYTLIVQNAVPRSELGVATSGVQFFRNVGSTIGTAVLGTVMSSNLVPKIQAQLPPQARAAMKNLDSDSGGGAAAVLDPSKLDGLPAPVVEAIRHGMGDAMHMVFATAAPFALAALLLSLFIRNTELRSTN